MIETLMRQWLMLRSIPRHPHRIDPQGIAADSKPRAVRSQYARSSET